MKARLNFDGGCNPNPGLGISAAIVYIKNKKYITSKIIEQPTNSNVAEYTALIIGLKIALDLGVTEISVYGDSMLVINQVQGRSRTTNFELLDLRNQVLELLAYFNRWNFNWVERTNNKEVDSIVRKLFAEHT